MTSTVPHRVAINALFLHYPFSGTGRYLIHLMEGLGSSREVLSFGAAAFPPDRTLGVNAARLLATPFDSRSRRLAKVWFEQIALPSAARHTGGSVAHVPYFAAPLRPRLPTSVTVHDLVPLVRPEYRRTASERLYTALVVRGLASAERIITDSQASAVDLRERLRIPIDRIRVIPLGVDDRFRPLETDEERTWANSVLKKYEIDRPYFLYVGGLDRRKNVDMLIRAFARLRQQRGRDHLLVIVGALRIGDSLFYHPGADLDHLGISAAVRLLGRVEDDEVRALQAKADAFVFPSLYEGFGLPPLEAMACGTPVVCSSASSLPEVVGTAGLLFDPMSEDALVAALDSIAGDADLRCYLGRAARERAADFTWERTVRATAAVWDELAAGR